MTKHAPERPSSVSRTRTELDEELSWWGNTPSIYWALGAPAPIDWLNGKVTGSVVEIFGRWWRETLGTEVVESHPLVWLPEWKRDFMVGWAAAGAEPEVPGAYPAVERLHGLGVAVLPLLNEITETLLTLGYEKQIRSAIRSAENRERDADLLDQASVVLEKWKPILSQYTPTINITLPGKKDWYKQQKAYPEPPALKWVANAVRSIGPGKRHRAAEIELLKCALKVKELIVNQIGTPRTREIGELLRAAFPEDFNPQDLVQATTKLLQRAARLEQDKEAG